MQIRDDVAKYLEPEFSVKIDYTEHNLFLQAFWKNKESIIKKEESFINKIKNIAEYFEKNKEKIAKYFAIYAMEEQKKNNTTKKEQKDRLNNLENLL